MAFFLERFGFISETGREEDGEAGRIGESYHNKEKNLDIGLAYYLDSAVW